METNLDIDFKTNKELEEEGVYFSLGPDRKTGVDRRFKVRRFHARNPRAKAAIAKYHRPYAKQMESGTLPIEVMNEISIKAFIDVCLVDWDGITDKEGNPIECNKENALALFKALPEVFSALNEYANDVAPYKEVFDEDTGN